MTHKIQKVSAYPQMREGQFKGRIHGTYRFKEVKDGHLVLELDPEFSPQQMLIPIDMLEQNDLVLKGGTIPNPKQEQWPWVVYALDAREIDVDLMSKIESDMLRINAYAKAHGMLEPKWMLNYSRDYVCYLSSTYDGKTMFFKTES